MAEHAATAEGRLTAPRAATAGPASAAGPAICCVGLWKVYGPDPAGLMRKHGGHPPPEALAASGHVAAVRDVSIEVAPGELLVVMGLSGSGKSTLVRCLSRLIEPTAGNVEIEGQDLLRLSERELVELRRRKMGMVFQNFALLPHRTVLDNVAFPLELRGAPRAERYARAMEVIRLVGLEGREDHYPRELSGGQQQRVGIARSLAIEPDIWFLDEPFSALDPLIRREMQDEFLRLQALLAKTIVFITHDFDEALRLADRIAIMFEGRIEQIDTPDRIVLAPATEYVAKFTRDIAKARVVRAGALARPVDGSPPDGEPVPARATIASLARRLIAEDAEWLPVTESDGRLLGRLSRREALDVLLEDDSP